jgi:acyl-coenzyme A thioesterase PaaI-like protein
MASKSEIVEFLAREFPTGRVRVEEVGARSATVVHEIGPDDLRPGGTVFGPVLMTVADVGLYVAILGAIGIVPLAVTTNLTINFMRRPSADRHIVGVCKLLKLGKRQAVGEVLLYSQGDPATVAHAIGTYSIPPAR